MAGACRSQKKGRPAGRMQAQGGKAWEVKKTDLNFGRGVCAPKERQAFEKKRWQEEERMGTYAGEKSCRGKRNAGESMRDSTGCGIPRAWSNAILSTVSKRKKSWRKEASAQSWPGDGEFEKNIKRDRIPSWTLGRLKAIKGTSYLLIRN